MKLSFLAVLVILAGCSKPAPKLPASAWGAKMTTEAPKKVTSGIFAIKGAGDNGGDLWLYCSPLPPPHEDSDTACVIDGVIYFNVGCANPLPVVR
jgi:hypothetical protein